MPSLCALVFFRCGFQLLYGNDDRPRALLPRIEHNLLRRAAAVVERVTGHDHQLSGGCGWDSRGRIFVEDFHGVDSIGEVSIRRAQYQHCADLHIFHVLQIPIAMAHEDTYTRLNRHCAGLHPVDVLFERHFIYASLDGNLLAGDHQQGNFIFL